MTDRPAGGYEAVSRETLADSVYNQLRNAILAGESPDGTEVNQVDLARQLGVSRVPVREALRRLQAERLLVAKPFHRYAVTTLSADQVFELFEVREELEVFALRRAVREGGEELQRRVQTGSILNEKLTVGMGEGPWLEADRQFHLHINGERSAVAPLIDDLRQRLNRYMQRAAHGRIRGYDVLEEHGTILDGLRRADEEATEAAIRAHVRNTRTAVAHFLDDATDS